MTNGVHNGLFKNIKRNFPYFFTGSCTFDNVFNFKFTLYPRKSINILLIKRTTKSFVIYDMHLIKSFETKTPDNCMGKFVLWLASKEESRGIFSNTFLCQEFKTFK